MSRRENFNTFTTLCLVPQIFCGKGILVDLRNETSVAGRLVDSDGYMNLTLEEVVFVDQKGLTYMFDNYFVPARLIRQMHLPREISKTDLQDYLNQKKGKREQVKKLGPRTLKESKTYKRHAEILKEIASDKQS